MLTKPTLLLDKTKCLANIERMANKANKANVVFRPHFKTHQSAEVGNWFRNYDVDCITVSSIKMAVYFANNGWKDITIAFPANILEWATINELASRINVNIVVESLETIQYLEKQLTNPVGTYIKTDTGYGRTGIDAEDYDSMQQLLTTLKECKKLIFIGFLCHAGHTYSASSKEEVKQIMETSRQQLLALKTFYYADFPLMQLSYGDTPSCSMFDDFEGFDEIRPGNCVFYDQMQVNIGSCSQSDVAVALAAPVVSIHKKREEVIVHGGGVHLSKDSIVKNDITSFGSAFKLDGMQWDLDSPIGNVHKLSQEHGIIKVPSEMIEKVKIGDMIAILPIHSCLTANLMKEYSTTNNQKISMLF